ncbi:uncharacterized protein [Periplaneta americana]|uniref:uncharacterized protein n=1 Tax=Periplaneta americana TaxID=6978 RepID=UPI0037E8DF49
MVQADGRRNGEVRKEMGTRAGVQTSELLKWKWRGCVSRLQESKWAHAAMMWGSRTAKGNVGRPKICWSVLCIGVAGKQWTRMARNGKEYRRLEKSLRRVRATATSTDLV